MVPVGWDINWNVSPGDPVLQHPLYQKHASTTVGNLNRATVVADLQGALADDQSAAVVAYLSWLIRLLDLVA